MSDNPRARIENRADGGVLFWLAKLYLFFLACLVLAIVIAGVGTYAYFAAQVPPTPNLTRYAEVVPATSRMYAGDGTLLGEFADEWREIVPFDRIPKDLVDAFLAAEDHAFFDHSGLYFKGILRAAWANLVAGDFTQGGSTITQQLAKQFLNPKASLKRKIKEAILARRLEARYSKKAILSAYLNHIYLGSGAFGIKAAALRYFSKDLDELDIAEMATLAGLAQAPSSYSPLAHPDLARERRDAILDRMARYHFISEADASKWKAQPLTVHPHGDVFGDRDPYFAEHVRRYVIDHYGEDALMTDGLRIETTVSPVVDRAAYATVVYGARKQDKRQGWRGAVAYLDPAARKIFRDRVARHYGNRPLVHGRRYLALVEEVTRGHATVLVGTEHYELPLSNMSWAAPWSRVDAENDHTITDARKA
ncbi:MAG TPA: transglycosylase domain-containing protein, partial [Kofleriaceae bacterium]|nr:transglycosylase domain-containing protein [Kofleriaceae bacterium]